MNSTKEIHRMALAAATAVVGRQRHRAGVAAMGLLLGGGVAGCGTLAPGQTSGCESTGELCESTGMPTGEGSTSLSPATTSSEASGTSEGSSDGGVLTGSTSWAQASTSSGSSGTGEGTDDPTGEPDPTATGTDTGSVLEDCIDSSGEVDWVCCEAQNWEPAEHCTPWGPPAPPRFTRSHGRGRHHARGRLV